MQEGIHRRQHPRVPLPGGLRGSLRPGRELRVLNLSPGGAKIENTERLVLGEFCFLFLRLGVRDFHLPGRTVWSHPSRCEIHSPEQVALPFRSGLRFADLPSDTELDLRQYLATLPLPQE